MLFVHIYQRGLYHIGVGSDVVCSTTIGNARASIRGIDNNRIPRFFYVLIILSRVVKIKDMVTPKDVTLITNVSKCSCKGLASNALPEVSSPANRIELDNGVSTQNVSTITPQNIDQKNDIPQWYALRCTYGQEKKAYEYIINHHGIAFYPTLKTIKIIKGKKVEVEVSRIPNIFFAYGIEKDIQEFVYDNINLPYLRFYYEKLHLGNKIVKRPLTVPQAQIDSLIIICKHDSEDIIIAKENLLKFKSGDFVRVIQGKFTGVVGHVSRYKGQQRVGVIIDGLLTAVTAYIPNAFLEHVTS